MSIIDNIKRNYDDWRIRKDAEKKVYNDALHEEKLKLLKEKGKQDAKDMVFKKPKTNTVDGGQDERKKKIENYIDGFGFGGLTANNSNQDNANKRRKI